MTRVAGVAAMVAAAAPVAARDPGISRDVAIIGQETVVVHVYRPRDAASGPLLFVFPGYERQAGKTLRRARRLARAHGMTVFAPELDKAAFPRSRYQRAGASHRVIRAGEKPGMGPFIAGLVAWARAREGRPDAPFVLFGHSAGAQMLSRVAAFAPPSGALAIIVANPSSYVAPSPQERAPFGFGSIADGVQRDAMLAAYLAQPLVVYLGDADTGEDRLDTGARASRQGANRLERGRATFAAAEALAAQRGWPFGWSLAIAPQVGHSARGMLRHPVLRELVALRP